MVYKKLAVFIVATAMAACAFAKPPTLAEVKKALPEMPGIESVTSTPIKGIYEVIGEANVLYVSEDLSYIFSGHILDVKTKSSLTDPIVKKMQARDVERQAVAAGNMKDTIKAALVANQKNFLKEIKGTGKDVVYMVTDIRCGFCSAMEKNFEKMTDITIYRIPVAFLGAESVRLGNAAWCAKDRLAAWKDISEKKAMVNKEGDCLTPLKENSELMDTWKIRGTPTFFRADGQRWVQGLMTPELAKIFIDKGTYDAVQARTAMDKKSSSAASDAKGVK